MKHILHVANWLPNKWHEHEGVFVEEQVKVFDQVSHGRLINVQVKLGTRLWEYVQIDYSATKRGYYVLSRITHSRFVEVVSTLLLLWALYKESCKKYDCVHVHIAYPLLTHSHLWNKFLKLKLLISEHWSAYHYNFYLPRETTKLNHIKRIFRQNIPLITVSQALLDDIANFSGARADTTRVIPNVVDEMFRPSQGRKLAQGVPVFFMVNVWREVKNPYPMLEGFRNLKEKGLAFELLLGGYGDIVEQMKARVRDYGLDDCVHFLGMMSKEQIAVQLRQTSAYLYSSKYETFSVACAQAVCSGVPLIGPEIPAIMEYADAQSRVLLPENSATGWGIAVEKYLDLRNTFDSGTLANEARAILSNRIIKERYVEILEKN